MLDDAISGLAGELNVFWKLAKIVHD